MSATIATPPRVRGTDPMPPAYRRVHRTFVLFNTVVPLVGVAVATSGGCSPR